MAHSKESMLDEMRLKGKVIMATLLEELVAVKVDQLTIPEDADQFRADFIRPAYYWIGSVYETAYAEVRRIKRMQTDEMWKRYRTWGGFEEHREVILMKNALQVLRNAIVSHSRPDFYKKSKRDAKKNKTKAGVSAPDSVEG